MCVCVCVCVLVCLVCLHVFFNSVCLFVCVCVVLWVHLCVQCTLPLSVFTFKLCVRPLVPFLNINSVALCADMTINVMCGLLDVCYWKWRQEKTLIYL